MSDSMLYVISFLVIVNITLVSFIWRQIKSSPFSNSEELEKQRQAYLQQQLNDLANTQERNLQAHLSHFKDSLFEMQLKSQNDLHALLSKFDHQNQERNENSIHRLKMQITDSISALQSEVKSTLHMHTQGMSQQFEKLNETTESRLNHIGEKVETKLQQGFEKTSQTFTDIVKRLALIDDAQKKIHDLSSNVVSLQEILQDKRARGAFGEIQLNYLLENTLPSNGYKLQHTLSNQMRADAMLFLPKPTGHIAIDAKFPLDNYKQFTNIHLPASERQKAQLQFKQDIKKHIQDISQKYIIDGETSDGAIMFIPAEAVFAEIHAHFPELVELAYKQRVWFTSPTTMMAILTTASAVLKDSATKEQVHVIQKLLKELANDFGLFDKRMDNLAKHLKQANVDIDQIHTTAKKITGRFQKIEKVELQEATQDALPTLEDRAS